MSTRITVPSVQGRKVRRGDVPLVMVTAYDAPGARMAQDFGAPHRRGFAPARRELRKRPFKRGHAK